LLDPAVVDQFAARSIATATRRPPLSASTVTVLKPVTVEFLIVAAVVLLLMMIAALPAKAALFLLVWPSR